MIEPANSALSIGQQCRLLSIARSSYYYEPKGETEQNLGLMRRIDERPADLETPFFGVRQMTWHLRNDGHLVNEKRIRRLMRLMGLMPICQKPNTSRPAKGHKTYPYLPMRRGFLYLVAIMDWHTRKVLAWRLSMDGKGVRKLTLDNIFIERLWRSLNRRTAQRNTSASTCMPGRPDQKRRPGSESGSFSTITNAHTQPLAVGLLPWSIG